MESDVLIRNLICIAFYLFKIQPANAALEISLNSAISFGEIAQNTILTRSNKLGIAKYILNNHLLGFSLEQTIFNTSQYLGMGKNFVFNFDFDYRYILEHSHLKSYLSFGYTLASRGYYKINAIRDRSELSAPYIPDEQVGEFEIIEGKKRFSTFGSTFTIGLSKPFSRQSFGFETSLFLRRFQIESGYLKVEHENGSYIFSNSSFLKKTHFFKGVMLSIHYAFIL